MFKAVRLLIIAAAVSLFLSTSGLALTEIPKTVKPITSISVTPTIAAFVFGGSNSLNPTTLFGVKFSYDKIGASIVDTLGLEATVNYFSTTTTSGRNADGYLFRGDVMYSVTPRKKLVPFLVLGIGDIVINRDTTSENSLVANYGLGVKYYLEEWLVLRGEARQLFTYKNVSTKDIFEFSAGLTYIFGKEHKKKKPAATEKKPLVAIPVISETEEAAPAPAIDLSVLDKLGISGPAITGIPSQPPTFEPAPAPRGPRPLALPPAGAAPAPGVEGEPKEPAEEVIPNPLAPEPQAEPEQPQAPSEQQAPEQPQGAEPKAPAPAVPVYQLKQLPDGGYEVKPKQPQPEKAKQQPPPKVLKRATVEFPAGSAAIRPGYGTALAEVAAAIKATPGATVKIEAFADSTGKDSANRELSKKRAEKMRDYLVKFGVPQKRISIAASKGAKNRNAKGAAVATVVLPAAPPEAAATTNHVKSKSKARSMTNQTSVRSAK